MYLLLFECQMFGSNIYPSLGKQIKPHLLREACRQNVVLYVSSPKLYLSIFHLFSFLVCKALCD